jgi:hypothetical protein
MNLHLGSLEVSICSDSKLPLELEILTVVSLRLMTEEVNPVEIPFMKSSF